MVVLNLQCRWFLLAAAGLLGKSLLLLDRVDPGSVRSSADVKSSDPWRMKVKMPIEELTGFYPTVARSH